MYYCILLYISFSASLNPPLLCLTVKRLKIVSHFLSKTTLGVPGSCLREVVRRTTTIVTCTHVVSHWRRCSQLPRLLSLPLVVLTPLLNWRTRRCHLRLDAAVSRCIRPLQTRLHRARDATETVAGRWHARTTRHAVRIPETIYCHADNAPAWNKTWTSPHDIHYITDIKYNTLIKSNLLTGSIFDGIDNKPYTIYQTRYNTRIVIF